MPSDPRVDVQAHDVQVARLGEPQPEERVHHGKRLQALWAVEVEPLLLVHEVEARTHDAHAGDAPGAQEPLVFDGAQRDVDGVLREERGVGGQAARAEHARPLRQCGRGVGQRAGLVERAGERCRLLTRPDDECEQVLLCLLAPVGSVEALSATLEDGPDEAQPLVRRGGAGSGDEIGRPLLIRAHQCVFGAGAVAGLPLPIHGRRARRR